MKITPKLIIFIVVIFSIHVTAYAGPLTLDHLEILKGTISPESSERYKQISDRIDTIVNDLKVRGYRNIDKASAILSPDSSSGNAINNAIQHISSEEPDKAVNALVVINKDNVYYPYSLYLLGWIKFNGRLYEESEKYLSEYLDLSKDLSNGYSLEASLVKAVSLYNSMRYNEAFTQFNKTAELYNKEIESLKIAASDIQKVQIADLFPVIKNLKNNRSHDFLSRFFHMPEMERSNNYLEFLEFLKGEVAPEESNSITSSVLLMIKGELLSDIDKILNEYEKAAFSIWLKYYASQSVYEYYMQNRHADTRRAAIKSHNEFLDSYLTMNDELERDVINRLIDLYSDEDGFSDNIIRLYNILTERRFDFHPDTARVLYESSVRYYKNNIYTYADDRLKRLRKKYPKSEYSTDALFILGEIAYKEGNIESALDYYKKAAFPHDSYYAFAANYRIGYIHYSKGDSRGIFETFGTLIGYIYDYKDGKIVVKSEEEKEGLENIIDILKSEVETILINNIYELGGIDKLFDFLKNKGDTPYIANIVVTFGNIYHTQKDYLKEIEVYKKLIDTFPNNDGMAGAVSSLIYRYEKEGLKDHAQKIRDMLISYFHSDTSFIKNRFSEEALLDIYIKSGQYYYFTAKEKGEEASYYTKAEEIYKGYLKHFKSSEHLRLVNYHLAEVFYDQGKYDDAYKEYSKVAWRYDDKNNELNIKAAYAAFLSAKNWLNEPDSNTDYQIRKKGFYTAGDQFINNFPDHRDTPFVILSIAEELYREKRYDMAIERFNAILNMNADNDIKAQAIQGEAQSYYYKNEYTLAEEKFQRLIDFIFACLLPDINDDRILLFKVGDSYITRDQYKAFKNSLPLHTGEIWEEEIEKRLWKNIENNTSIDNLYLPGEVSFSDTILSFKEKDKNRLLFAKEMIELSLLKIGAEAEGKEDFKRAGDIFIKAALITSDIKSRIDYLYKAAEDYAKGGETDKAYKITGFIAINYLNGLGYKYQLLFNLSSLAEKIGDKERSALILKKGAFLESGEADNYNRVLSALKAGVLFYEAGRYNDAIDILLKFFKDIPVSRDYLQASFILGESHAGLKDINSAKKYYKMTIDGYKKYKKEDGILFAANADFKITEYEYSEFENILNKKNLSVEKKIEGIAGLLKKLTDSYSRIINYGIAEITSASYYRIGSMYEEFSNLINKSSIPDGLSAKDRDRYKEILEKKALEIREKALDAYRQNSKLYVMKKVYNAWISLSMKSILNIHKEIAKGKEEFLYTAKDIDEGLSLLKIDPSVFFKFSDFKD